LGRAYSGNHLAKTIEAQREQVQRAELSTAGEQYGQHRLALDLEAFGREYAAQKQQAEREQAQKAQKQTQERTTPQQTPKPKPPRPSIGRGGDYGIGD